MGAQLVGGLGSEHRRSESATRRCTSMLFLVAGGASRTARGWRRTLATRERLTGLQPQGRLVFSLPRTCTRTALSDWHTHALTSPLSLRLRSRGPSSERPPRPYPRSFHSINPLSQLSLLIISYFLHCYLIFITT